MANLPNARGDVAGGLASLLHGGLGIGELVASVRAAQDVSRLSGGAVSRAKGLIGSGDRSDRIRTYNFAQGRLTDHRINLTLYKLLSIMEGDLDDVIHALQVASGAQRLQDLEQQFHG